MTADRSRVHEHGPIQTPKGIYSRQARRKLLTIRSRLKSVDAKLSNALDTGVLHRSTQLEIAQRGVEKHLTRTEEQLDALRKSDLRDWVIYRDSVEHAWEDLHRAIRNLMAHLPQQSDKPR